MRLAAGLLVAAAVFCMICMEFVRSFVHKRREQQTGLGGTQDIALWGTLAGLVCMIAAAVCFGMWFSQRESCAKCINNKAANS